MIFTSFASGSSGNCTFIESNNTKILIDCGISAKRIDESLKEIGYKDGVTCLDAVFITHEHSDHIKGLKRLMASYGIPVYSSQGTLGSLFKATRDEYFHYAGVELMHVVSEGREINIKGLKIIPFRTFHDSAMSLCYRVEDGVHCAAVTTDTGYFDDYLRDMLLDLDVLLLEANHDRSMLVNGKYPVYLKRRIMSREGHLSNNSAGSLLSEIISPRLKYVILGHLSRDNNTPSLAFNTVMEEITQRCGSERAGNLSLSIAPPDGMSELIRL
ncbi:MAG: MBL fold metallo-hydrolase [Eubacteriales bacterium]|nr:MBL fold metallo-hydrolase [Eubacteriales bacterium]